ncbi:MAG: bifunctional 4-hydroxy-2-oxoglutarate aldolase/2-dehydro-3-deoxy-phosphogluconate aldolase [Chloroflexi bacterium]|nr:bifunctional 4-hydroxy-2-oxoglutarate aldolase/2-dehydro-3-deoxy-phosphogluconate aldolase [Chloroflexota bacterium]MCI0576159.1 bifunctional 4-hydroxy-2-oxoglutarate aldolase/2-dehydro-3-deoxy-phosphogluconate aldolase [Chloroflexota bacterium]MCI0645428.1 bifunctional 4-hydroxy-2-oxoglutarate aldolase/2-dehydro-3-deoxy-phosphogluconate aldolase [Chloroflexota bacterium]MCI0731294.1 bifunctional 4-hydroxy-2-oxoglutarate aldolase/2-dehydro-3-deoxy-phosphogluconate aldolase [Chloroflexota bact
MDEVVKEIGRQGVMAIVRGRFTLEQLAAVSETLAAAGVTILEITLNTTNALVAIEQLRRRFGDSVLVGAGTVRTVEQLDQAMNAGAQFTVAPNFDQDTVAGALASGLLHLPGVFTATEAETAHRAGCQLLKLFPSDMLGPGYLKALRAPLDDVDFVPTGGISAANIGQYRRAGAFACGIGSALVKGPEQPLAELAERTGALRRAWEEAA